MASLLAARARPLAVSAAIASTAGIVYYSNVNKPIRLDSAATPRQSQTFSFPSSMLFSRQLTVTEVEQINHDTKRVTFSLPGGANETTGVPAGSAILTQHTPGGKWFPVLRPYTPVQDTETSGQLQLVVKKYQHGKASGFIHSLQPGDQLTARGPIPGYAWKASSTPRDVLFVAGGAGITPLYSLARSIVSDGNDQTRIKLLWGVNGTRDIVLRQELEALQRQYPEKLQVTYIISGEEARPETPSLGPADKFRKGYIDEIVLQEAIQSCKEDSFGDEKGTKVFFCGPPSMQAKLTGSSGTITQLGIAKKATHIF